MTEGTGTGTAARACANHPSRAPVGLCRRCGSAVCNECHTRLDGILHCRACVGVEAKSLRAARRPSFLWRVGTAALALVLLVPALLALRGGLVLAGTVGGRVSRLFAVSPDGATEFRVR